MRVFLSSFRAEIDAHGGPSGFIDRLGPPADGAVCPGAPKASADMVGLVGDAALMQALLQGMDNFFQDRGGAEAAFCVIFGSDKMRSVDRGHQGRRAWSVGPITVGSGWGSLLLPMSGRRDGGKILFIRSYDNGAPLAIPV